MKQLIEYLNSVCDIEWKIKRSLEDKALKLILTSSIIIPIIIAVVIDGYYIDRNNLDIIQIILLLSAVFFGMMTIRHAIEVSKPIPFPNLVDTEKFIDSTTGKIDPMEIDKIKNNEITEFENKLIESYIRLLDFNKKSNKRSSKTLEKSFGAFKFLLLFVFFFILAVLFF